LFGTVVAVQTLAASSFPLGPFVGATARFRSLARRSQQPKPPCTPRDKNSGIGRALNGNELDGLSRDFAVERRRAGRGRAPVGVLDPRPVPRTVTARRPRPQARFVTSAGRLPMARRPTPLCEAKVSRSTSREAWGRRRGVCRRPRENHAAGIDASGAGTRPGRPSCRVPKRIPWPRGQCPRGTASRTLRANSATAIQM